MWWFSCFKSALWTWTHDDSWIDCWFGHLWRSEALHLYQQRPLIQHQHHRKIYGDGPKLVTLTSWNKECMSMNRNSFHVSVGCRYRDWTQQFEKKCEVSRASGKTGHECHPNEEKGKSFAQSVKVFGLRIGGGLFLGRKSCCIWQILSLSKSSSCTKSF